MSIKKQVIRVELSEGFLSQVTDLCRRKNIDINDAIESGLLRELRYHKNKDKKESKKDSQ